MNMCSRFSSGMGAMTAGIFSIMSAAAIYAYEPLTEGCRNFLSCTRPGIIFADNVFGMTIGCPDKPVFLEKASVIIHMCEEILNYPHAMYVYTAVATATAAIFLAVKACSCKKENQAHPHRA